MSFSNVYYKRTTATAKGCYVCYKPTTTVLATVGATDFVYTCPVHLTDRGFASVLGLMEEEIGKIKEEWEEKQKKKEGEKSKDGKSKDDKDGKSKDDKD
ncbi:hypothetical protein E4T56_gene3919, partial [Termitomyces sp. T112]